MKEVNIKIVKTLIFSLLGVMVMTYANAQQVSSPDGKLTINISTNEGKPGYSLVYNGKTLIQPSTLGLNTNVGDFTQGLTLNSEVKFNKIDEKYSLPNIKKSQVHYFANEAIFSFSKDNKPAFDLIFRVSNNDVAFRYMVHRQGERAVCMVNQEATSFILPQGTTTFLSPQMDPMTGFARTAPSYEAPYTADDAMGKNGWGNGYIFPCLFRVNNDGWVLISETGVDSRYCASHLTGHENGLYTIAFPNEKENNGNGTSSPGIPLPGFTPWRTITVGNNLSPIVETTIPFDVVEKQYNASQQYEYTKGSWSWIMKMDGATVFEVQKQYIDFSASMGYKTVLVDALWDTQIGYNKIEELAKYGASKGVSLYLWYNSNGYWNDAPQGPKDKMNQQSVRRKEMAWMKSIGIKGIKVDFFGGDKQMTMKLYEDILTDANDFGLLVVFHGCTLPRGWERMFPNYGSSEAVLASEMLYFSQERCNYEAYSACMHPFIRNTVGSMDFGGSALNKFYNGNNTPNRGSKRITSDVFALATAVLFQSPIQHFALAPNNLTDAPDWAIDFMKNVPNTWDDIKFIDGYPGKYIIMARRSGSKWYVAGINAQSEPLNIKATLPMIKPGSALKIYSDDQQLNGKVTNTTLSKSQEVNISIPGQGGFLLVD